jgi:uncharacterized lipoprotein YehR (DUF1307 family)
MSKEEQQQYISDIAELKTDIKYIVRSIDELTKQNSNNVVSHSTIYSKIDSEREKCINTYATKESVNDMWNIVKGMIATAFVQLIAVVYLLISRVW